MRDEMKKVPRLRFRGFQEDWELCKLDDLLNEVKRPVKIEDHKEYQLVTVKRRNGGVVSRGNFKGENILVKNYFVLKKNDYLISKRQVVHGANGIVPENMDGAVVSNEYLVSVGNESIKTDYLTIISQLPQMYKLFFLSSYGIDIEKLVFNVEDWKKRTMLVPNIDEQVKIASFFKIIDDTITLHQRKLEQLKELKTAYLQLMFVPTNTKNNKVPKLRFANFEENWELCKLENIIEKQIKGKAKVENLCNGSVEYLDANRLNGGKPIYTKALPDVSERDIIILWDGSKAGKVYYGFKGVLGSTLKAYQLKECANSQFIYQQLLDNQNNIYNNYRTPNIPHVVKNFSSIFPIWMTSFEEQSQMADILSNLDNRIILQQNLTDTMISLKKSYLQNMFI
ncbi:restriction endonuclease subunit S [Enterococcus faecalis]|uniref:restriction endonuclease subunit S n=1 Tax=Enterococcus faecalis TaxID=1351 RepID=UPI001C441B15|nr:restriction endonuclease subunit S [Enterococcus faecalis]QXN80006.1 restriction endonuclease subunit S [Enterococcus faecalis]